MHSLCYGLDFSEADSVKELSLQDVYLGESWALASVRGSRIGQREGQAVMQTEWWPQLTPCGARGLG